MNGHEYKRRECMTTPKTHDFAATPWQCSTLVELLRWRARHQPERRAYTFLVDGEVAEVSLTYAELDRQARSIAAYLQSLGATGERALLLYPPGLEYIAAFLNHLVNWEAVEANLQQAL